MKRLFVCFLALAITLVALTESADSQKKKRPKPKKAVQTVRVYALKAFMANVMSEMRILGKDTLITSQVELDEYPVDLSTSGTLDSRHEEFVANTDTINQQLFYAGATNVVPVKGSGKNRNAWQQHALAGVRPEAYSQFARAAGRIAKVLEPITGSDFKGVMVARVTFRDRRVVLDSGATRAEFRSLNGRVGSLAVRVGRLEEKEQLPPPPDTSMHMHGGAGYGLISGRDGESPRGLNVWLSLETPERTNRIRGGALLAGNYQGQGGISTYADYSGRIARLGNADIMLIGGVNVSFFRNLDLGAMTPWRTLKWAGVYLGPSLRYPIFGKNHPIEIEFLLYPNARLTVEREVIKTQFSEWKVGGIIRASIGVF